jgi:hypothetical protein
MTNPSEIAGCYVDWSDDRLAGWTYVEPKKKWFQGSFRNVHRLERVCPTCKAVMGLEVTLKALTGEATNHGFALRRCKPCRAALKEGGAAYQARKAPGTDTVQVAPAAQLANTVQTAVLSSQDQEDLERLQAWETTFYEVLRLVQTKLPDADMTNIAERVAVLIKAADDTYAAYQQLRATLAKYELAPAMAAVAENKMPWQG